MATETVPLSKVKPNPFRRAEHYPIRDDKVQTLIESMSRTGFWDNVVARQNNGQYELAYGHHRLIAFEKKYGKKASINLIVRDIPDADMLRMMADENMQEWDTNAEVEQETIRAVVLAYSEGKIEFEDANGKSYVPTTNKGHTGGGVRFAPSFVPTTFKDVKSGDSTKPYNAESIGRFLGWMSGKQVAPRVRRALTALEIVEEGLAEESDVRGGGMTTESSKNVVARSRDVYKSFVEAANTTDSDSQKKSLLAKGKRRAKKAAKIASESFRNDGRKETRELVTKQIEKLKHPGAKQQDKKKAPPSVTTFCRNLAKELRLLLGQKDKRWAKLNELIKYTKDLDGEDRNNVTVALRGLSDRCLRIVDLLEDTSNYTRLLK